MQTKTPNYAIQKQRIANATVLLTTFCASHSEQDLAIVRFLDVLKKTDEVAKGRFLEYVNFIPENGETVHMGVLQDRLTQSFAKMIAGSDDHKEASEGS